MVMFLQGRRLVKADELAEHFEISVRTVYRDMSALGEAGVPIVEAKPLARALWRSCEVGDEIPAPLYEAVRASGELAADASIASDSRITLG